MPDADTMTRPDFVLETFIRTDQDTLWDALMKGEIAARYHFASARVTGDADGAEGMAMEFDDGRPMLIHRVIAADPKRRVEMTFEPKWFGPDTPASRCTFLLEPQAGMVKLRLEHYELPEGQDGVREGWARWASSLKSYLETGRPLRQGG